MQYLCDLTDAMPCHWLPATSHPPFYRECYGFERAFFTLKRFLPYTPSYFFQGFPGSGQFSLKISRASCWSSKHSLGSTICLNHSNLQKIYTSRFYLRVRAGQSRDINFCRELVLQNVSSWNICFSRGLNSFHARWLCLKASCLIHLATEPYIL